LGFFAFEAASHPLTQPAVSFSLILTLFGEIPVWLAGAVSSFVVFLPKSKYPK